MNKRLTALLLCLVFILGVSVGAMGAGTTEEIKAMIDHEMKMKLDGRDFIPLGADGQPIRPILYKGSSYLPVRVVAQAVSVAVDYDAATKTIYLGERDRIPLLGTDFAKNYTCQFSEELNQLFVNGEQYEWGIVYTGTDGYYEFSGFVYPNGKYQIFGGIACLEDLDGEPEEVIIKIREDDYQGRVLKEITVHKGESIPFEIEIPQIKTLYIQNLVSDRVPKSTNPDKMMIAEPYFK